MVRAGVAELKASLSEYLRRVKAGEEVIVTDHGRPIARLAPIARTGGPTEAEMDELVAAGLMTPRKSPRDPNWLEKFQNPRPTVPGARLVEAVIEEREAGWWTHERPAGSGFVCLDQRLRAAAAREGFDVLTREFPGR